MFSLSSFHGVSLLDRCARGRVVAAVAAAWLVPLGVLPSALGAQKRPQTASESRTGAVVIDGFLNDEAWTVAQPATGFVQREPREGLPATEETEFRVLHDQRGIFFAIRALDSEPERLVRDLYGRDVAALRGRNQFWGQDDAVTLILDTFQDGRSAYYFSVNPNASMTDALILDEGQILNFDWQGVWEAAAQVDEQGWTAEIFIPWTTLRFPNQAEVGFGLNVQRFVRRKTEESYWSPIGLDQDLWRISMAGDLTGLQPPGMARALEAKPFVTVSHKEGPSFPDQGFDFQPGLDVKVGVTESLTADFTWNTDFAQVEVDEQQVNLTRFALFFPEKREFFLENAGLFEVGVENFAQLFFSRRIGLGADGSPVPIQGGGRLSGRVPGGFEVGALGIRTSGQDDVPGVNHSVLRLRRKILERSTAGVILTHLHQGDGGADNRVVAFDMDLNPWRQLGLNGYVANSFTEGDSPGENWSTGGILHWNQDAFGIRVVFMDHQENFRPGLGFLPRPGVRHYQPGARVAFRPGSGPIRRILFRSLNDLITDRSWNLESRNVMMHTIWTLNSDDQITLQYNGRFEDLEQSFAIHPSVTIRPGQYHFNSTFLRFTASERRRVSGTARYERGNFWSGERQAVEVRGAFRFNNHLAVGPRVEWNDVQLAEGDFTTTLSGVRLDFSPTNRITFNAFVQYNDAMDRFTTNLRLDIIHRPGSDLFLVYNDGRDISLDGWPVDDRQHILKVTYLMRR
ncbi:MAG: DUF5916 domain-containing protein [Gemmatimonadota bacterium]